jgi:hypothetical protein
MAWKDSDQNRQVVDWLLDGPAWLRFATEKQLLDSASNVQEAINDPAITDIIKRLKDRRRGFPAISEGYFSSDEYENPYWDLYFLGDIGLSAKDAGLTREIESFLDLQLQNGAFLTESGMSSTYLCKSAIILSSVARMGYWHDARVEKYIRMFLPRQRLDGGWYCNPNHDTGTSLQYEPSCPQENLNLLMLLGQYEWYRGDARFRGAIDLLLRHWETGQQIVYFGVGRRYRSLGYPATRYGILRVLDALSWFPFSFAQASYRNMLGFVHRKASLGRYTVEAPSPYTDIEASAGQSRLLTFIINRIDKRFCDAGQPTNDDQHNKQSL